MAKLSGILSSIFLIIIIFQMLPTFVKNFKETYEDAFELKTKVGLIKIKDSITDISTYNKNLKKFFEKDDIKAILLHIESPGGAAGSSQALYNEILNLKKEYPKPIITLTNDLCASGAYYIACATDYIIASPMAIVGSIGSYIGSIKVKDFIESWKIKYNLLQSGKYKTSLNPFTENTKEINDFIQTVSDDVYKQFMNDVATRRKISLDKSDKWASGLFFTGRKAKELGLIDETGSESNALRKIRELAMLDKDRKIEFVKAKKPSKLSQLLSTEEDTKENISFVDQIVEKICLKLGFNEQSKAMLN